ncbi:MerR family transcriptional regulator [Streptomyces jumonjinensis]|uniref:MerR family transcriptional regulator n=2 Tax=Streptomyces jumonjinensis TaxID=1945 RepID=A0A646KW79_STRJU|nr:MerR family transcriptional regulator [Streptomyces jumonjinensis]
MGIGELARLAGVSVKTVRFYSDEGLLPIAERSSGGHRRYGRQALERLRGIRDLRALEMPLPEVAAVLEDEPGGTGLAAALTARLAEVSGRLSALRWREAALRALAEAPGSERPALLRQLGALPQPPDTGALARFWRRVLPVRLPSRVREAVVDAAVPDLPRDPTPGQAVTAARLHTLASDSGFAADVRRANGRTVGRGDLVRLYDGLGNAYALGAAKLDAGIEPEPGEALDAFAGAFAQGHGEADTPEFRVGLLTMIRASDDPRLGLYWRLVHDLQGGGPATMGAAHAWLVAGLACSAPTPAPALPGHARVSASDGAAGEQWT